MTSVIFDGLTFIEARELVETTHACGTNCADMENKLRALVFIAQDEDRQWEAYFCWGILLIQENSLQEASIKLRTAEILAVHSADRARALFHLALALQRLRKDRRALAAAKECQQAANETGSGLHRVFHQNVDALVANLTDDVRRSRIPGANFLRRLLRKGSVQITLA